MDAQSVVWGLDIGHSSIKAVKLQRAADGVVVLGYAIEPIPGGDEVDRDEAVAKALTAIADREDMRSTPVVAALSGRQIFTKTINVPVINPKKVDKMVELEARQQIPGNFDEVRWGYHMSPATDGVSNDVALFAARLEIVDDLIVKCKKAGLSLVGISVTSLAVYNFINFDQEFANDETVIVLDVGAENTDLVLYQGDTLWMRTLGVSGNAITRAFVKKFRVSFEEAEALKTQVGDSRQADRILKVIEPSLAELVSEVQRSIGFYKSQNSSARFENVVVSGNTFRLPGLAQYMADRLGYAIITLIELERVKTAPGLDRGHFLDDLQSLAVAMGLGLQGLGVAKANVNLLPSSLRLQSLLKTKRWAGGVLVGALAAAFGVSYLIESGRLEENYELNRRARERIAQYTRDAKAANDVAALITPKANELAQYQRFGGHQALMTTIETAVFKAVTEVAAMNELVTTLDRGGSKVRQPIYFDSLKIDTGGDGPFRPSARGRTVTVSVRVPAWADRVSTKHEFEQRLKNLRIDPALWQARNPRQPVPEELPMLFTPGGVQQISESNSSNGWTFIDMAFVNELGQVQPKREQRSFDVSIVTYACTLADGEAQP